MSDTDGAFDPTPGGFINANRRRIVGTGMDSLADDPAKVARSYELGRATGTPAALVYSDLDNHEEQTRAALTASLLSSNDHLREYIDTDGMHAKLSNDDWPILDEVSKGIKSLRGTRDILGLPTRAAGSMLDAAWKGMNKGFGEGPLGGWTTTVPQLEGDQFNQILYGTTAIPIELPLRLLAAGIHGLSDAAQAGSKDIYKTFTGDEQGADRFGRDIAGMVEMQLTGMGVHGAGAAIAEPMKVAQAMRPQISKPDAMKAIELAQVSKLWVDSGKEPPAGLHPEIDKFKLDQNNEGVKELSDLVGAAQRSATRERDAETFATFYRLRDQGNVEINGDAVWRLYGDKVPELEDNILGFHPEVATQLELAKQAGGDISIPLADFVAKVDPEVFKALKDDIRVRPGGITKNEAIVAREAKVESEGAQPPPLPEDLPTIRAASALEPMFSIGDRNLKIEKRPTEMKGDAFGADQWRILGEKGDKVGHLELTQNGDRLYVDNIIGMGGLGPRDFGPALMRSLLRQIKEAYPDAKQIGGFRVSGAREKAGSEAETWIKLDNPDMAEFQQVLEGGQWETYSPSLKAYIKPDFLRSEEQRSLVNVVNEELQRIVPSKLHVREADWLEAKGATGQRADETIQPHGAYIPYTSTYPALLFSLEGPNPLGTARHEAIHHLRTYGFFKDAEWGLLEKASTEQGWMERFQIKERYPTATIEMRVEESIADAYKAWKDGKFEAPTPEIKGLFEKMKDLFDRILARIEEILGKKDPTWEDVFQKVDTGEVGGREGTTPRLEGAYNEALAYEKVPDSLMGFRKDGQNKSFDEQGFKYVQPVEVKLPDGEVFQDAVKGLNREHALERARRNWPDSEIKALEDKLSVSDEPPADPSRVFERANALGMSIDQYKRYEKLIDKRHAEDIASAQKRIDAIQRRQQTKEWKDNRKEMRSQVAEDINLRPDIAADNYFADGMLYGEKVERIRLGTDFLTEEQRAALPRDYYIKAGVHPDELASLFGYPDGASLVQHLSDLSEVRRASGMRPIEFKRRLIDLETDRQMRMKYGELEGNILDAVKDQVASETQLSLLHEETVALGMRSGTEPTYDKAAIKRMVADEFEKVSANGVSSDKYLATAGRAGKAAEMALLKEDPAAAFREKQRQFYATLLAREAIEFEAQAQKFGKLANQLSKREVKAVEPEYLDYIHGLLGEGGAVVKRSPAEIADSKAYYGGGNLSEFVASKNVEGWDLAVSEALQDGPAKPMESMTVAEMRDFMDAVTSLNHVGRKVRSIEIAGEKKEFADFRDEVIANIQELPARSRESQNRWFYKVDASLTRMEEIAKDLDLRKELGPLHQAVIEPMMRSKAKEFDLMTDLSKHFQETRGDFDKTWRKSLHDTVNQDVLHDPYTGVAYDMTKENLIQVMLNWGNRSNIRKFVQGAAIAKFGRRLDRAEFEVYENQIKGLIDKHASAQDWQFVQRMWEPFKKWQTEMTDVSRSTSGVAPKLIESAEVETPHGKFPGGYWPVKYDRLGSNAAVIQDRRPANEGVFGGDYFRAATSKGYLKERTGYVDFVDISTSLEQAASTMQQTIHDIAFRDSLIQAGRVFYDKGIRAAIRKHYGAEYEAQLVPWLRRIAHQFSTDDASVAGYNDFLRRVRINLVGHALPLNLKVILSPDIGVPNPKAWASHIANRAEDTKLAMEKSDEIRHLVYNMDRDFRESLDRITLDPGVSDLQKKAVQWGFGPIAKVSQEFRVITFVDQYHKALGRGKTETEAALIADSFVRERHGAASAVDLPAVMQSNEGMKMLTMFYGYFNTMYNWQRQLPGNVRRGEAKEFAVNGLGSVVVGAAFGAALFNQRKQDDSWFKIIGKALLLQPLSTIPVLNTAASYVAEGFQPRTPFASLLGAAGSIVTDAKKLAKHERLEKPITHGANVVGLSTGLPLAQVGRTAQFGADVATGHQRPKNIGDWARGIITGEAKLKK